MIARRYSNTPWMLAFASLVAGLILSVPANATTFDFSYDSGTGDSASGQFFGDLVSGSQYNLTGVTGTETDSSGTYTITGLSTYGHEDNQLYLPPSAQLVSLGGISFLTSAVVSWNIYYSCSGGCSYYLTDSASNPSGNGQGPSIGPAISLAVSTTPLPAALPLFASGFGALGLLGWRRKRKAAAPAA